MKRIRGEPSSGEMSGFGKMSYKGEQRKLLPTLCNMGYSPAESHYALLNLKAVPPSGPPGKAEATVRKRVTTKLSSHH